MATRGRQLLLQVFKRATIVKTLQPKYDQMKDTFQNYWTGRGRSNGSLDALTADDVWHEFWKILDDDLIFDFLIEMMDDNAIELLRRGDEGGAL